MPAISIRGLGKDYRIVRAANRYPTLREAMTRVFAGRERAQYFTALHDVSFEVAPGEIVGIVGGNGAGKSTLLRILSRVTKPTRGRVDLRGRVGSLLEVGTGFHPELSGRENVFLNGAILGMRRTEIARKFDDIVAFAEVAEFIDTPVKRYSSGMHLRLAFAVAAHLEPEILLVDEVLAVGDASFQRKCLGKMEDVARSGRTVLVVSHNMDAVTRLCPRSVLLERGALVADGPSSEIASAYLSSSRDGAGASTWIDLSAADRTGTGEVQFVAAKYDGGVQSGDDELLPFGAMTVDLAISSNAEREVGSLAVSLCMQNGTRLVDADIRHRGRAVRLKPGRNLVRMRLDRLYLNPGSYNVGLWIGQSFGAAFDHIESAFEIRIVEDDTSAHAHPGGIVPCDFDLVPIDESDAAGLER